MVNKRAKKKQNLSKWELKNLSKRYIVVFLAISHSMAGLNYNFIFTGGCFLNRMRKSCSQ